MNFLNRSTAVIATVIVVETLLVQAIYRFLTEDQDIFRACSDITEVGGPSDFIDFSGTDIFYDDEGIHMNGSFVILWDVKGTDRVSLLVELKKFVRGGWQPTPLVVRSEDVCKDQKNIRSYVYEVWSQYVFPEDLHCFEEGITYRHKPFVLKAEANAMVPMEGRYKVIFTLRAFDENDTPKSKVTCTGLMQQQTSRTRFLMEKLMQVASFSKASRNRNEINYFGNQYSPQNNIH
ncbi:hypothetical protein GQX74_009902 [Glossina fuscipes]|nr:hypothetical protein GQX74_009902 [Glossina fuscipes]